VINFSSRGDGREVDTPLGMKARDLGFPGKETGKQGNQGEKGGEKRKRGGKKCAGATD